MERINQAKREKDKRHMENLAGYTGYWHGMYFLLGVYQPNSKHERTQAHPYQHDSLLAQRHKIISGNIFQSSSHRKAKNR